MAFFRFSMTLRLFSVSPLLPCYEHNSQIRHGMLESQIWRGKHLDVRDTEKNRQFAVWECLGKTSMFQNVPKGWTEQHQLSNISQLHGVSTIFLHAIRNACKSFIILFTLWKKVFSCHLFRVQKVGRSSNRMKKHFEALNWLNIFLFAALAAFYSWFSMWGLPRWCNDCRQEPLEGHWFFLNFRCPSILRYAQMGPGGVLVGSFNMACNSQRGYLLEWCRRISPFPITQISWLLSLVKHMIYDDLCRLPSLLIENIGVTANKNFPVFHVSKLASLTLALSRGNEWRDGYKRSHEAAQKIDQVYMLNYTVQIAQSL